MKKNMLKISVTILVLVSFIVIPPLQSLAMNALSIFRVDDVKTIKITIADIQEVMDNSKAWKENHPQLASKHHPIIASMTERPKKLEINTPEEFKAFDFKLPGELKEFSPKLTAIEEREIAFKFNEEPSNDLLRQSGISEGLPGGLVNTDLTLLMPAAITADYDDLTFFATQMPYLDAPQEAKEAIKGLLLQMPILPENISQQIALIDVNTRDIYLPEMVGVGRQVDLGSTNGYLYTMADIKAFTGSLPAELFKAIPHDVVTLLEDPNYDNASLLIWTEKGVIFGLAGIRADGELTRIAKSVN